MRLITVLEALSHAAGVRIQTKSGDVKDSQILDLCLCKYCERKLIDLAISYDESAEVDIVADNNKLGISTTTTDEKSTQTFCLSPGSGDENTATTLLEFGASADCSQPGNWWPTEDVDVEYPEINCGIDRADPTVMIQIRNSKSRINQPEMIAKANPLENLQSEPQIDHRIPYVQISSNYPLSEAEVDLNMVKTEIEVESTCQDSNQLADEAFHNDSDHSQDFDEGGDTDWTANAPQQQRLVNTSQRRVPQARDLTRHVDLSPQRREPPFECLTCHKRYVCKGTLMSHARIHTSENKYAFTQCDKKFKRKRSASDNTTDDAERMDEGSSHLELEPGTSTQLSKDDVQRLISQGSPRITYVRKEGVRVKSTVWEKYKIVHIDGRPTEFVKCLNCHKAQTWNNHQGTTAMNRHNCTGATKKLANKLEVKNGQPLISIFTQKAEPSQLEIGELNDEIFLGLAKDH